MTPVLTTTARVMDKAVDVIDALRVQLAARERLIVELRQMLADVRADLAAQNAELVDARGMTQNARNVITMVDA